MFNYESIKENAPMVCETLKNLSHETRLMIICYLTKGEANVSQIEEALDIKQSVISQQLAKLKDKGYLKSRRDGKNIYYSLQDEKLLKLMEALHAVYCNH